MTDADIFRKFDELLDNIRYDDGTYPFRRVRVSDSHARWARRKWNELVARTR